MPMPKYLPLSEFQGYLIGDNGTVLSCLKVHRLLTGRGFYSTQSVTWKQLKTFPNKTGRYICVTLLGKYIRKVHILVLTTFIGPCPEGMECRHLDGNRSNNNLSNLCWGTKLENWEDRKKHGNGIEGSKNKQAKLCEEDVLVIRALRKEGWSLKDLVDYFGVSDSLISAICTRKAWTHI